MSHVEIIAPTTSLSLALASSPPEGLLVGRKPDVERLRGGPFSLNEVDVRPVTLTADGLSANHALIWKEGTDTRVMDLGSRNGSWVRLVPFEAITIAGGAETEVRLGLPIGTAPSAPDDATWTTSETFDQAVMSAVETWLQRHQIAARVFLSRETVDSADTDGATRLPLSGRAVLNVVPGDTVSPEWGEVLAVLWRYVDAQRRLLSAEDASRHEGMVLASPAIRRAHREVVEAAKRGLRMLLLGPTGAGKEGLARAYHAQSGRAGQFVALNCSELNKDLLRAELFGAEEGSFTGSVRKIVGAVEQANGGTLFLDELGELPLDVQPMLLRFLDRGEYVRLGSYGRPKRSDVRIVGATNRDLRHEVKEGRFREDLWFRLSICVIEIAGLRDRLDDVREFLRQAPFGAQSVWDALTPDAIELVNRHQWDGNFRELSNFVSRLAAPEESTRVDADACRRALSAGSLKPAAFAVPRESGRPPNGDWEALSSDATSMATTAFHEDYGAYPNSWAEVKELIENYLKPILFARLSGAAAGGPGEARTASRLGADRGTAMRQIERYFERYGR